MGEEAYYRNLLAVALFTENQINNAMKVVFG